jgi:hypothetical protein
VENVSPILYLGGVTVMDFAVSVKVGLHLLVAHGTGLVDRKLTLFTDMNPHDGKLFLLAWEPVRGAFFLGLVRGVGGWGTVVSIHFVQDWVAVEERDREVS